MTEVVHRCLQVMNLIKHLKTSVDMQPCKRLCERCERFSYLHYLLLGKKSLITTSYEEVLTELQHHLEDTLSYVEGMMRKVLDSSVTTSSFRLLHAETIAHLTLHLLSMEETLLRTTNIAYAWRDEIQEYNAIQRRHEDLEVMCTYIEFEEFF